MSRLDSMIKRMTAQRACLNAAFEMIADVPGVVFEIGLGNGRTYDHERQSMPGREIFVFDRQLSSHPDCRPDAGHAILGDVLDTLPRACERFAGRVALVHSDIGNGIPDYGRLMSQAIGTVLPRALAKGAVILSDEELEIEGCVLLPEPPMIDLRRYFMYRKV